MSVYKTCSAFPRILATLKIYHIGLLEPEEGPFIAVLTPIRYADVLFHSDSSFLFPIIWYILAVCPSIYLLTFLSPNVTLRCHLHLPFRDSLVYFVTLSDLSLRRSLHSHLHRLPPPILPADHPFQLFYIPSPPAPHTRLGITLSRAQ